MGMKGSSLGYAGLGTSGYPNTRSVPSRPDISGAVPNKYRAKNNGVRITVRRSRVKTRIKNPKI